MNRTYEMLTATATTSGWTVARMYGGAEFRRAGVRITLAVSGRGALTGAVRWLPGHEMPSDALVSRDAGKRETVLAWLAEDDKYTVAVRPAELTADRSRVARSAQKNDVAKPDDPRRIYEENRRRQGPAPLYPEGEPALHETTWCVLDTVPVPGGRTRLFGPFPSIEMAEDFGVTLGPVSPAALRSIIPLTPPGTSSTC